MYFFKMFKIKGSSEPGSQIDALLRRGATAGSWLTIKQLGTNSSFLPPPCGSLIFLSYVWHTGVEKIEKLQTLNASIPHHCKGETERIFIHPKAYEGNMLLGAQAPTNHRRMIID
jgi:hypothetical protein